MLSLYIIVAFAFFGSIQTLPLPLTRRSDDLTLCGVNIKRSSGTYSQQCKLRQGYDYVDNNADNINGKLFLTAQPWKGNPWSNAGMYECDHLVEAQWISQRINEKLPNTGILDASGDYRGKGATFCRNFMRLNQGAALITVMNEGDNMRGVPTGVNQLKKMITVQPDWKNWDKQVFSLYNYNKASEGVVSYLVQERASGEAVAGRLFDALADYDAESFPGGQQGSARAAWVRKLSKAYDKTIETLNDPIFKASQKQKYTPRNPANNPDLMTDEQRDAQTAREENAVQQAVGNPSTGKASSASAKKPVPVRLPSRFPPSRLAKDAANANLEMQGSEAMKRDRFASFHWARSLLSVRAPPSASSKETNWCPEEPTTTRSISSASSTAAATQISSGARNSTATASSSGKSRTSISTSVTSGSLSSTGASLSRTHASPTATLDSDADVDMHTPHSAATRPTTPAGRSLLASRPLATSISTHPGAGASAAVQPTRSALRASGVLLSPIQSIASPLRNSPLPSAHSLVSPGAAARPTSLSSPASAPPRPGSGGTIPRPQAGSDAAPLPAKPISKPSAASSPSRGSKKLGRLFSRDLGGI